MAPARRVTSSGSSIGVAPAPEALHDAIGRARGDDGKDCEELRWRVGIDLGARPLDAAGDGARDRVGRLARTATGDTLAEVATDGLVELGRCRDGIHDRRVQAGTGKLGPQ